MKVKRIMLALILVIVFTCLSAFNHSFKNRVSRFDLGVMINQILETTLPDITAETRPFSDLSESEMKKIRIVTALRIMNGFPQNEFRPSLPLRNHEVLHYLHRTWQVLQASAPRNKITARLALSVGFGRNLFYRNLGSSYSIFSGTARAGDYAGQELLERVKHLLRFESTSGELRILVEDALTGNPVKDAFVGIDSQARAADSYGEITVAGLADHDGEIGIIVSAPGYHSLKFKRNLLQKNTLRIKLRPVKSRILIKAFSRKTGEEIKNFRVQLNDGAIVATDQGEVVLKPEFCGYHEIKVLGQNREVFKKNVYAAAETIEINARL
ncbi:MAG: S-layer homology domain-containing protein [Candidatus Rifleibacteriota bacterium]